MDKDNMHPSFPRSKNVYKYDSSLDAEVTKQYQPIFNTDGEAVVMDGTFKARRDAQIKRRKEQGK